jgi:hypothetical protein
MSKQSKADEGSAGREKILAAGMAATIKQHVKNGGNVLDALDAVPKTGHADVVEHLHRLGLL